VLAGRATFVAPGLPMSARFASARSSLDSTIPTPPNALIISAGCCTTRAIWTALVPCWSAP
jgi:hypothetical protein